MIHLKSFSLYTPESPGELTPSQYESILWLKSAEGVDWYDSQSGFRPDTLKIVYNSNNIICASGFDVSAMFPVEMSVIEVDKDSVPDIENVNDGTWMYEEGIKKVTLSIEDIMAQSESKKKHLMDVANENIVPLQDAVDLDIASDREKSQLLAWKKYRVLLNRIEITGEDILWPETPDVA